MPLQTIKDYPGILAQHDNSGLARGIYKALSDTRLRYLEQKDQEAQLERDRIAQELETASSQAFRLRGIGDGATDAKDIQNAFIQKKRELASLGYAARKRGDEEIAQEYEEMLKIENIDDLNLALGRLATRGEQARKKIMGTAQGASMRSYAPITLVKPGVDGAEDENILVSPTVDPATGQATLSPYEIPEGYEIATETPAQKRQAEMLSNLEELSKELEKRRELEPTIAAETQLAKDATQKAEKLFEATDSVYNNISNLQDARQAVLDGAGTGPIERLWPSFRSASTRLDNVRGRLGLDVVGATTFGALSKGELDLAKDVALPTGLDGPDLVEWLDRRIAAQQAKAEYLQRQAVFLSETNAEGKQNTRADWAKSEKAALQAAMDWFAATQGVDEITDADIVRTMKVNNMSRSDVLREIRRRYELGGP